MARQMRISLIFHPITFDDQGATELTRQGKSMAREDKTPPTTAWTTTPPIPQGGAHSASSAQLNCVKQVMIKKAPHPVDKHVGSRVRLRRMMLGMSQEKLGDELG